MWKNYVAIGDSITEGYGDAVAGMKMRGWVDWVVDALRVQQPDLAHTNLGWRGSVTADVLTKQLQPALEAQPDLVSITVGANDARRPEWTIESFAHEYEQLLNSFAGRDITLFTVAYPDMRPMFAKSGQVIPASWRFYFERMEATNSVIRRVTAEVNGCLVDLEHFTPLQDPVHISSDLVHPNSLGYQKAAEATLSVLAKQFNLPQLQTA